MPESRSPRAWYRAGGLLILSSCAASASPPAQTPSNPATTRVEAAREAEPQRVSVSYQAPADCPKFDAYAGHVSSRSNRFALEQRAAPEVSGAGALPAPELSVEVEPNDSAGGYRGQLSAPEPRPLSREVNGERCSDVVAALALITVLRLDAMAEARAAELAAAPASAPASGDAAATLSGAGGIEASGAVAGEAAEATDREATPGVRGSEAAESKPEPRTTEPASVAAENEPADSPEPTDSPELTRAEPEPAGAVQVAEATRANEVPALAENALEPDEPEEPEQDAEPARVASSSAGSDLQLRPRVALFAGYATVPARAFELTLDAELRLGPDRASWAAGLAASYARGSAEVSVGQAALTLLALQAALCPPGAAFNAGLELRACALMRVGALDLSASSTSAERPILAIDTLRPWAALGGNLELMLPLSPRWSLGVLGEVVLQLVRDRFEVETLSADSDGSELLTLYRPEAFSVELGLGIAYAF